MKQLQPIPQCVDCLISMAKDVIKLANFETLYPQSVPAATFYLFKVKCEPIQNYIQAPVNSFMALWKDGQ